MERRRFSIIVGMLLIMAAIPWGINLAYGNGGQGGTFYANSPLGTIPAGSAAGALNNTGTAMQKFVDTLPGLGPLNANDLGTIYIPVATPIANPAFPNDDYYEIGIVNYTQQMHSNLPATTQLRGYVDLNQAGLPAAGSDFTGFAHYLGPVIVASQNKPVRVKFTNHVG